MPSLKEDVGVGEEASGHHPREAEAGAIGSATRDTKERKEAGLLKRLLQMEPLSLLDIR